MNIQGIGQQFTAYSSMGTQSTKGSFDPSSIDASQIIEQEDSNQDGVLSIDETSLTEEMFSDADTDSDGQVSKNELEQMLANGPPPPPMGGMGSGGMDIESLFEEEDEDEDGMISVEESNVSSEIFSSIDTNQDGQISVEEMEQSRTQMGNEANNVQDSASSQSLAQTIAISAYQDAFEGSTGEYGDAGMGEFLATIA